MKTAVSVPDDVFAAADALAEALGVSRSELYATAVAEYVAKHRTRDLTAQLDRVYAEGADGLADDLRRAQADVLTRDPW